MNNKGFGLQELLVFIGLFMFILVAVAIYWKAKFGSNKLYEDPIQIEENQKTKVDVEPIQIEIPKEYKNLEEKLVNASKKYAFDRNKNNIITLKQLQNSNLIGKLVDPNDSSVVCDGYVIYNSNTFVYNPYINCTGMYVTESYNSELNY